MSIEDRVLNYLRSNPGATPREIADALGVSLASVRVAINRLRELGYVIRSSKGGYVPRVSQDTVVTYDYTRSSTSYIVGDDLLKTVNELVSKVGELEGRVRRLEDEVKLIKKSLPRISTKPSTSSDADAFLSALKLRGVMGVDEFRKLTNKPLDDYINSKKVILIGDLVVHPDFLETFKSKFPIKVSDTSSLSNDELRLLETLIKTNRVYLFSGIEYRILD